MGITEINNFDTPYCGDQGDLSLTITGGWPGGRGLHVQNKKIFLRNRHWTKAEVTSTRLQEVVITLCSYKTQINRISRKIYFTVNHLNYYVLKTPG